ncbi:hypothetical protein EFK50_02715 [Nocardioides marmoriginsengisoli]|uniref:Uncharacterized protein n=1 Tax=Nocardioides marmoriginsengisoli TaxID=661483 RepID=A0A3N0CN73_9ACTN|nr:hypothetical protein [Nocardioides marmoriginsengisoli]RNL64912.1 hypothetical protein EFK50_02715 [Nocardioides marmoriginsengisoli]
MPLDPDLLHEQLRRALIRFVGSTVPRQRSPAVLHLGTPGSAHLTFEQQPAYDSGLWADVIERALDGLDLDRSTPVPWVTRTGELSPGDHDFGWFAAVREGFGRHGLDLPGFFVMNQHGWFDLTTDTEPTLCRVRRRKRRALSA